MIRTGSKPILVSCVTCGVVFDLRLAKACDRWHGRVGEKKVHCFVCPLGHPGHASNAWYGAQRREPTEEEKEAGLVFMLRDYDVSGAI